MHCIKSRFEIRKGIQILIDYDEEEKEIDKTGHYRDIYKHGFICCPPQKNQYISESYLVLNFTILEFDD